MRRSALLILLAAMAACAYELPAQPTTERTPDGVPTSLSLSTSADRVPDLGGSVIATAVVAVREGTNIERVPVTITLQLDGFPATNQLLYTGPSGRVETTFHLTRAGFITARAGVLEQTVRVERGAAAPATPVPAPAPPAPPPPAPTPPSPALAGLSGTVTEGGAPVAGMNVEIRTGADARRETQTNAAGTYAFTGLQPGLITVRAWKSGYVDIDRQVTLAVGATGQLDFQVSRPSEPTPPAPPAPPPPPPSGPTAPDVEYVVTGVRASTITISNEGEGTSQYSGVNLPWSYKFSQSVPSGNFLYVSAQNDLDNGCIKVQIFRAGTLYKQSESCGAYVIASASGSR